MRRCSVASCERPFYAKGYCQMHWSRWKRNGDPLLVNGVRDGSLSTTCQAPGCERPRFTKSGWCETHYRRIRRTGTADAGTPVRVMRASRTCSIKGCERKHYGRGWCNMHWVRWRHTGDPNLVRPNRANSGSFQPGSVSHNKGVPMSIQARSALSIAKRGQVPWNKGRPWPAEWVQANLVGRQTSAATKALIRRARSRQTITSEHRQAISRSLHGRELSPSHVAKLSGPNNYRYRGRMKRNLSSKAWRTVRALVLDRDNRTCQTCGTTDRRKLVVHHIVEFRDGGKDVPENLVTWCRPCHTRHHSTRRAQ